MIKKMKISRKEQIDSIVKTLDVNSEALDYIENHILQLQNVHKLTPEDVSVVEEINLNKYIKTNLFYIEECYFDRLKVLGYKYSKRKE